ncbi:hypothetical protein [Ruegeria sp. HKCCD6109]|uniref:hypothetical protein n=1 Tax=Ruegeria sp. HKCCD6109 TaxID=2683017 RepID=UPI001491A0BB|nr:hypothetical protein [Ruegeria sp. HKCCD6109]NOD65784.1 hypothetical protein [Ruegeria sp. HKCCD6109]
MTLRDTITAFVHTRILPLGGKGTGDVPPSSPVPIEQWGSFEIYEHTARKDEILRKGEGQ